MNVFGPGNHGTTFGGNPLSMRAGVETLRIMEEDGIMANAAKVGAALRAGGGGLATTLSVPPCMACTRLPAGQAPSV